MAEIAIQDIDKSSQAHTYSAAASGGDSFDSFNGVFVHAVNVDAGASRVITIAAVTTSLPTPRGGALTISDVVITVPISGERLFAVPATHIAAGGTVTMTYDDETDLTLAVLRVAQ